MSSFAPENYLWRAVVHQAFRDGLGASSIGLTAPAAERLKTTSREWILGDTDEFRGVCDLAGIDPDWLARRFRQVEHGREIFLNAAFAHYEVAG